jgi:hypothetical protein
MLPLGSAARPPVVEYDPVSRLRKGLLIALAAFVVLVALAPTLLSTGVARRFVAGKIAAALGRPVEVADLEAGWGSGITLRGLDVRSAQPEFRGAPLVQIRSVRLDSALPGIVFGDGARNIVVEGLTVRLEEQAGGRTNVDDLWAVLRRPPPAEKREPKPMSLRLVDASIHVRRLPRRPQPHRIDPFREDPVILDADEGLLVMGIDALDLRFDTKPGEVALDVKADLSVAGREGRADVSLRVGRDGPSGHVDLQGIDLALAAPFVPGGLAGRLDVRADGAPGAVALKARVRDLAVRALREEWIDLEGRMRQEGNALSFEGVAVRTASGAFTLDGRGSPRDLDVTAEASLAALQLGVEGRVLLRVTGKAADEGLDLAGSIEAAELAFEGLPEPGRLDVRFDAGIRGSRVVVRSLEARAPDTDVSLAGEVTFADPPSGELSGRAEVDLAGAHRFLRPFLPEGTSLAGRLRVPSLAVRGGGDVALKADASVENLVAGGFFEDEIRVERSHLHIDAVLADRGDVLRVARAQLDQLSAQGTVAGLKSGATPRVEGTVKGTLALNPLHARLLGLDEVRGLRGQVNVDVIAEADDEGRRARGTGSVEGLHIASDRGTWDLATISAEGSFREAKGAIEASLRAGGDGFSCNGSFAEGRGGVELDIEAIERQPLLVRALDLPPGAKVEGPAKARVSIEGGPGAWVLAGTFESAGLTAQMDGRGIVREPLRVAFEAREGETGWSGGVPEATLLGATLSVKEATLDRDGRIRCVAHLAGPLDRLAKAAPEAKRFAPGGKIAADATVTYDGGWNVALGVEAQGATAVLSGKRTPPRTARIDLDAALQPDGTLAFHKFRLKSATTDLAGTGVLGEALSLRLKGRARVEEWSPFVPALDGKGDVTVEDLSLDVTPLKDVRGAVTLRAESLSVTGAKLTKAHVRSTFDGKLSDGVLLDLDAETLVAAARAERDGIVVEDLVVKEKGGGRSDDYVFGARVEVARAAMGTASAERIDLDLRGRLADLLSKRPLSGLLGNVTFARGSYEAHACENGRGEIALEDGRLGVRNLLLTYNRGQVRLDGSVLVAGERLEWEGTAKGQGIVVTEQVSKPISFILPFLRVEKNAGRITGRVDFDLRFGAKDVKLDVIQRTLSGGGTVRFLDFEVRNSILLPLIALRVDKAFSREPYQFNDLRVSFSASDGRVRCRPFELQAKPYPLTVKELDAGFDGSVNCLVVAAVLPLRVHGTIDHPKVRPAPLSWFK